MSFADATAGNAIKPAASVQVTVYLAGTVTKATIYGSRSPSDLTPLANPQTTPASGLVEFWAEYGSFDIFVHDTIVPARLADKTFGWEATSGSDRSVPSVKIAGDGNLLYATNDAVSKRQDVPLGGVIDWWRPSSTYDAGGGAGAAPPGWQVCDGSAVVQANHDFGAIGTITMPDLRNAFVLGASLSIADGNAGVAAAGAANAPGIRGAGGSNATHSHTIPAHFHSAAATGATISLSAATTSIQSANHSHNESTAVYQGFNSQAGADYGVYADSGVGGAVTGLQSSNHTHSVSFAHANFSGTVGLVTGGTNGDAAMTSSFVDSRPAYVGLLKIMKIRRS